MNRSDVLFIFCFFPVFFIRRFQFDQKNTRVLCIKSFQMTFFESVSDGFADFRATYLVPT